MFFACIVVQADYQVSESPSHCHWRLEELTAMITNTVSNGHAWHTSGGERGDADCFPSRELPETLLLSA